MFRLIELLSGQIQNTVLVHSVSAHNMGSQTVYKIILTLKITGVFYIFILNILANRIKRHLSRQYNFVNGKESHNVCTH
jgi:hypothetical protein